MMGEAIDYIQTEYEGTYCNFAAFTCIRIVTGAYIQQNIDFLIFQWELRSAIEFKNIKMPEILSTHSEPDMSHWVFRRIGLSGQLKNIQHGSCYAEAVRHSNL